MRRRALRAVVVGAVIGVAVLGGVGTGPGAGVAPGLGESHAPNIPGPALKTVPGAAAAQVQTSRNWSGYALTGTAITSVTGSWNVPQVQTPTMKRHYKRNSFSSSWVGIDGDGNSSLIQAGTEQDWLNGHAFYQAWWEILPAPETPIPSLAVSPGDAITVSITQGIPDWTITVTDTTTSQSFSTTQVYAGPLTSAEWIQEAPTIGNHVATLAVDSTAVFDTGTVNGANPGLVGSDAIAMIKGRHKLIASPSVPDADTDGFAVAYGSVAPAPPAS